MIDGSHGRDRLIDELNWVKKPKTMEALVEATRDKVIATCDACAPRRRFERSVEGSMYWWNEELTRLRRECLKARRECTRSKGNRYRKIAWRKAKNVLKKAMKKSQAKCWKGLIAEVEKDTWDLAYKIVTKKLIPSQKTPGLDNPQWVREIITALFPREEAWTRKVWKDVVVNDDLFTFEELRTAGAKLKTGTASGLDGIQNEILRGIIQVYPEMLLNTLTACLQEGVFFSDWKKQKLVLLRKGEKPLNATSSYRPICLLDSMGKLLEGLILQRLDSHMTGEFSLSPKQFGLRKGHSTVDAIQAVVDMAKQAREVAGRLNKKGFCALVSIDICNAFNSVRWENCIAALERKRVPAYLIRMLDNYLSDRWVVYEGDSWTVKHEMTCGTPQGSRVGPIIWNITFDDLLEMELPESIELVGFADDTLVVCQAHNVDILELRVNESLRRVKRWLDGRGLQMALHKTEAVLVTDRRSFSTPKIILEGTEVKWKNQLTHLGVELDRKLMPNVEGPREAKRRVLASVFHSKLLYAAPVWATAVTNYSLGKILASAQRSVALRIASAYRTVSTSAILDLASVPPIDLLALERKEI